MSTPRISRIEPRQVDVPDEDFNCATISVWGTGFALTATAEVIGMGTIVSTTKLASDLLECKLDAYGSGGFVLGVIVLNDPNLFTPGTSSNVFPLPVPKRIQPPDTDDSMPF